MANAARGGTRGWRAVRHLEDDGGHIWLRQAATFTVEGQTRTVEIAVPLRPGADADEIEALLREADAGMERLSRHLDARVAALSGGASAIEAATPAGTTEPMSATPAAPPATTIAETPARPAAVPMPDRAPAAGARELPAAPPPPTAVPARETPAAARPSGPPPTSPAAARPAPAPSSAAPAAPSPTASVSAEPLGIADFLATVRREFDYNPKQAMERLSVRTLSGLNLREALEMLRRQALRDGAAVESAPSAPSAPAAPARVAPPTARSAPAPTATVPDEARYFEEEDDEPEVAFGLPDEDGVREELGGYEALDGEPGDLEDELGAFDDDELEDVPDFAAPPPPARRAASARAAAPAAPAASPVTQPSSVTQPAAAGSITGGEARSRAMQIVGQLRGARAGGTPSAQQRTAYRNVVTNELGEARARALAQGVYRVAPDRLGPEQYDALISWGKRDTFAEEVDVVLAALRAERASSAAAPNGAASTSTPAPAAPVQPPRSVNSTGAAPRSGARGQQSRPEGG